MTLPIIEREFPIDPEALLPAITSDSGPFWNGLMEGRLVLQACRTCHRVRFPIAPVCPHCGETDHDWREMSGRGTIFSWIRYHRSYLPEFADLLPYVVITAELEEGVRMIGRLLKSDIPPASGMKITTVIERWPNGRCVPVFSLTAAT